MPSHKKIDPFDPSQFYTQQDGVYKKTVCDTEVTTLVDTLGRSFRLLLFGACNNVHENITHVRLAENECNFHVTRVQIVTRLQIANSVCLDFGMLFSGLCNFVVFEKFTCAYSHQIALDIVLFGIIKN